MNDFVHLHNHTTYSLLDGQSKIPDLCRRIADLGMTHIAVTDHGNLHGALALLRESRAAGILPILGMEAYCAPSSRFSHDPGGHSGKEHAFHLTLLAQNAEGFRNLIRLSSLAFLEGFYHKPRIDREILARHSAGLICLSGCVSSEFSDHVLNRARPQAESLAAWYAATFPGRFFVEIQCNGIPIQRDHEQAATDLANRMGLPLVATSDAHYLNRDDAPAHDLLLCINTGRTVNDPDRMRFDNDQFFVRSPAEMYAALPHHHEALARSAAIAATVEPHYESFGLGKRQFPSFAPPPAHTPETYLRSLCEAGLATRYPAGASPAILGRLDHELSIINRMGFASYFLIVWDFVRHARESGIPAFARGSACGAIVSYLLHISHVDPLQYDLLFERFLDPSRSEAPDIDIDLCKLRRAEVLAYVRNRYGDANVAQIATFGTMGAKASIKDVGRALGIPLPRVEAITKLIPSKVGTTIRSALADPALMRHAADNRTLFDMALRLEGTARSVGTHAAGVVIGDRPLSELVPLQMIPKTGVISTQWEMGDIEAAGLLKMDFLGSRNLTSLIACVSLIRRHTPDFDVYAIPMDDPATFAMLQRGEARGVFQLDGTGIRDLLVRMKPDRFEDIIAILALYRPGPMESGMVDTYVNVKHGRQVPEYIHPIMREILEVTHGVMVYQESIMRVLNQLGGIELTRAYACIKAISKKKLDSIKKFHDEFISGSVANGLTDSQAERVFEMIQFFSGYGFNRCAAGDERILRPAANASADRSPFTIEEMYKIRNDKEYAKATGHADLRSKWRSQRNYGKGLSLCDDGRVRANTIEDIQPAGIRTVYKITLQSGESIRVTGNHKFPTDRGEMTVDMINILGPEYIRLFVCGEYEKADSGKASKFSQVNNEGRSYQSRKGKVGVGAGAENTAYTNGSFSAFKAFRKSTPDICADAHLGGCSGRIETHHISRDRSDSSPENLIKVCVSHHKKRDYASGRAKWGEKGYPLLSSPIRSIEPDGECMTYDVTMAAPRHTFAVSSGIITCNSHSCAYAYLAYQTAYLKANHPAEFMASLLSSEMDGSERDKYLIDHIADARRMGLSVVPPDINISDAEFVPHSGSIRFGLSALKGLGRPTVAAILAARVSPFLSLDDFARRVGPDYVDKSTLSILTDAGAFDSIGPNRAQHSAMIPPTLARLRSGRKQIAGVQNHLFTFAALPPEPIPVPDLPPLPDAERLAREKKVLGIYMSGHPLTPHVATLRAYSTHAPVAIPDDTSVILGGLVTNLEFMSLKTKAGSGRLAKFTLETIDGPIGAVVWPSTLATLTPIAEDSIGFFSGKITHDRDPADLIVDRFIPLADAYTLARGVVSRLRRAPIGQDGPDGDAATVDRLHSIITRFPGTIPLYIEIIRPGDRTICRAGSGYRVRFDPELFQELAALVGADNVLILGGKTPTLAVELTALAGPRRAGPD